MMQRGRLRMRHFDAKGSFNNASKPGPERKIKTCQNQKPHQPGIPDNIINLRDNVFKHNAPKLQKRDKLIADRTDR